MYAILIIEIRQKLKYFRSIPAFDKHKAKKEHPKTVAKIEKYLIAFAFQYKALVIDEMELWKIWQYLFPGKLSYASQPLY